MNNDKNQILALANSIQEEVIKDRRYFRQHPELSRKEYKTQAYIMDVLTKLGIENRPSFKTGVIAEIKGNLPGKTVALRADMDALQLNDESGLPFASTNEGVSHGCGHDAHVAVLLGTARVFAQLNGDFPGTIRFLFQPSEEAYDGGARHLIADGALTNVDYVLGNHIWQPQKVGTFGIATGSMMGSPSKFEINIQGRGGHSSMPSDTSNPVLIAADVVKGLNEIVGIHIPFTEKAVLATTMIQSGTAFNIIPDRAVINGSVRTFSEATTNIVEHWINEVCQSAEKKYGCTITVDFTVIFPPVINAKEPTEIVRNAAKELFGEDRVEENPPSPAGEDFSLYQKEVPGTFFFLGTGDETCKYPHHHPKFMINEGVLVDGVALMTYGAIMLARA